MNLSDRLINKGIVSTEVIGGDFERMATYKTDGTLRIEGSPEYQPGIGWGETPRVILQNWEEICKLRDYLNRLAPIEILQEKGAEQLERDIA